MRELLWAVLLAGGLLALVALGARRSGRRRRALERLGQETPLALEPERESLPPGRP